jgi:hypothetical protein
MSDSHSHEPSLVGGALRIKTKVGNATVHTFSWNGRWIIVYHMNGKSSSTEASSLLEAGQNHLNLCVMLQNQQKIQSLDSSIEEIKSAWKEDQDET